MKFIDKQQSKNLLFILPSLLGVCIFVLIPSVDVIRRSFVDAKTHHFAGLQNFVTIFHNHAFLVAAGNTLKFIAVCIPTLMIISLAIALLLTSGIKGGPFFKSAYLFPMAIPVASIALMWRVTFEDHGLLNGILSSLHLGTHDWMHSGFAFWIVVGSYVWKYIGYNVVLWMAGLLAIPKSYYEAAWVDGAGKLKCFFYITLPNMKSMVFIVTILAVLNSFKSFREVYMVAGNYPNQSIYMLQHIFNNWYRELSLDKLSAAAVVFAIVILIFVMLLQKFWASESLKGDL